MPTAEAKPSSVAVAFLLRGAGEWRQSAERFLSSYLACGAAMPHEPHLIVKGFDNAGEQAQIVDRFTRHGFRVTEIEDFGFDITAYRKLASQVSHEYIGFFNTNSEILGINWLAKFMNNMINNNVSMVSATGSYESLSQKSRKFPKFPNLHLRSNAFFISRKKLLSFCKDLLITTKEEALAFESGYDSITRAILRSGERVGIVGRDGRCYGPEQWPFSDTYRQGTQANLLVGDNVTRTYDASIWTTKDRLSENTWGKYRHYQWQSQAGWLS